MTRDEMRYMLENEGVLNNEELEMLQGVFLLIRKLPESHGPTNGCIYD